MTMSESVYNDIAWLKENIRQILGRLEQLAPGGGGSIPGEAVPDTVITNSNAYAMAMGLRDGVDGDMGPPGQPGRAGLIGERGPPGEDGLIGSDGAPGPAGIAGAAGANGADGAAGAVGKGIFQVTAEIDDEETTTTLKSHTVLIGNLLASSRYYIRLVIKALNDGAAEGMKVALGGTVGVSDLKAQVYIYDDTLNTLVGFAQVTALDATVGAGLSSGVNEVVIEGSILTTTAGTLLLKYAQNAAGANAGVHVQPGSTLLLIDDANGTLGGAKDADFWVETAHAGLDTEVVVGTTGIHTAAYASRNAAAKAGRLFLPSDGFVLERDTGAAWAQWGPVFPFTAPVDGDFAWINQGAASVVAGKGGIYLLAPAAAASNIRLRKKASPGTPYVITAAFLNTEIRVNSCYFGLSFREVATGELHAFGIQIVSGVRNLVGTKYNSPTAGNSEYFNNGYNCDFLTWLRIEDNGTNRICSYSADGQNWIAHHTIGRTDFLTADEVGFFCQTGGTSFPAAVTLVSWKQT